MKRLASLSLAVLLMIVAGCASAVSLVPFYNLSEYLVDYDEGEKMLWVEYGNLSTLKTQAEGWSVYMRPLLFGYEEDDGWHSMLQLYWGIDTVATTMEQITLLVDEVSYYFTGVPITLESENCSEISLPCGKTAVEMIVAMITTKNDVRVSFGTSHGDLDFIMTDAQRKALSDLYHAYVDSDVYNAPSLEEIDSRFPVITKGLRTPFSLDDAASLFQ